MVSKVISISEKVNSLSLFGRLLYTWMIPHADDFGRLPGSPAKVRALVVPMADETVKEVEAALQEMASIGLTIWYEVDGERFLQINNFEEHQQGLHKRTKSKFPEPPVDLCNFPGNSGKFPLEENRTEQKRNESTSASSAPAHENFSDEPEHVSAAEEIAATTERPESFYAAHERIFGFACNPLQAAKLAAYIDEDGMEEAVVIRALERAALKASSYNFNLVIKILNDYADAGAKILTAAEALDNDFEARRQKETAPAQSTPHGRGRDSPQRTQRGKPVIPVIGSGASARPLTKEEYRDSLNIAAKLDGKAPLSNEDFERRWAKFQKRDEAG